MAIYYINPHTTTNGTGTFASPWSLNSSTRTGLAAGDEIRVLGVPLTSLLTATTYTATWSAPHSLTITSGGGLGADWAVGDVCYLPDFDTFFVLSDKSGNIIGGYTGNCLPIFNTSVASVTIRRVNTATYPAGSTGTQTVFSSALNNITISDCWTDATTRVTDGSVKTLFWSDTTSSNITCNLIPFSDAMTGTTVNLQNTHLLGSRGGNSVITVQSGGVGTTINLNQLGGLPAEFNSGGFSSRGSPNSTSTFNLKSATRLMTYGIGTCVFNITNFYACGARNAIPDAVGFYCTSTINIDNYIRGDTSTIYMFRLQVLNPVNIFIKNVFDVYGNGSPQGVFDTSVGAINVTYGSGFVYYRNKRATTVTSISYGYEQFGGTLPPQNTPLYYADIVRPPGITIGASNEVYLFAAATNSNANAVLKEQGVQRVSISSATAGSQVLDHLYLGQNSPNVLFIYRNGDSPQEMLGIKLAGQSTAGFMSSPRARLNNSVFRTAAPSLETFLQSFDSQVWAGAAPDNVCRKQIKIPVTSGQSYTVTGYVRTNETAYANGDCRVYVYFNNTTLASQSLTTACINAWEQFTLTFTATTTGEALFSWEMHFSSGSKSFWLDDLTIS